MSRHLGLLRDGRPRQRGARGRLHATTGSPRHVRDGRNGFGPLWALLQAQFDAAAATAAGRADDARLEEVRRLRKENFEAHAGPDTNERQLVPGRSWAAWARALGHLLPPLRVADLGCGEGYLTVEASRWASRGHCGRSIRRRCWSARARWRRAGGSRTSTWKRGELEKLPIRDEQRRRRAAVAGAASRRRIRARAIAEAARILVPGGRVLVLDLREHDEAWVRERLGDRWLGLLRRARSTRC